MVDAAAPEAPVGAPRLAWFHCFSGIAGDMALGALIDAGASLDEVRALCERLPVGGWVLDAEPVQRVGLAATKVWVRTEESSVVRTAAHIAALVDEARLPDRVRARAQSTFEALARAEGRLHRRPPEQVHFHEVGGLDAIIDVVGTCAALEVLGIDEIWSSPVAQGHGVIRSAHGLLPNPAPAVIELLRDAPTFGLDIAKELTTPTGAALVAALATGFGPIPAMRVEATGFGAGTAELEGRPNVTQVVLGTATTALPQGQEILLLEANVDDATGENLAQAIVALLEAGANDAWLTPIVMKKGRPAFTVSALVDPVLAPQVAAVLLEATGSLGLRGQRLERWPTPRAEAEVDVLGRVVRVKVSAGRVKVEFDDAMRAARHTGRPVREVISLAEEAWRRRGRPEPDAAEPSDPLDDDHDPA